jgi:hypothetical protein
VYWVTLEIQRLEKGPYLGTNPELPRLNVLSLHSVEAAIRIPLVVPA